jgi:glycosyltransferase involved in cell wall biosynthesis
VHRPGRPQSARTAGTTVVVVNARSGDRLTHGGGGSGDQRRTDFGELADALGADTVDWDTVDRGLAWRWLSRWLGFGPVAALLVFFGRKKYDAIWCFTEVEGLTLSLLFKLFRVRRVVFIIGVETLSPKCLFLLRRLRVWTHFTAILPTSSYQAGQLRARTSMPAGKVIVLPYQVDCKYFSGRTGQEAPGSRPYVVAVGVESRDYGTLIEAVRGLDVRLEVAAASHWAGPGRKAGAATANLPDNVHFGAYSYDELRSLYSGAAVAVVPLRESVYQHGITAVQEAMAMGLPVIVTRTLGQSDVIIDRRRQLRDQPGLGSGQHGPASGQPGPAGGQPGPAGGQQTLGTSDGTFARLFAPGRADLQRSNGFYVGVGDVDGLRATISYLLRERDVALDVGAQAQHYAREVLSLELFVERAVCLVTAAKAGQSVSQDLLARQPARPQ